MSFFKPHIPLKQNTNESPHPWVRTIKDEYTHIYKYGHNSVINPSYPQKAKPKETERIKLVIIGNRTTKEFIYCYYLAKGLYKYKKKQFEAPVIRGVTSVEWPTVLNNVKIKYGAKAYCLNSGVAVIVDDMFLGGENELKEFIDSKYVYHLCLDYYNKSIQQLANFINSSGRPCAYMHFSIDGEEAGYMIFMLYFDLAPRTCENFLRLCETTKGGYPGTPVHRIVKDCWIQCGGFGLKDYPELSCENFIVPHDSRGILGMANNGRHVDCSTQFYVLLQPASWMQHKYVAFGQLIEGDKTLTKIENVPEWHESPTKEIIIYKTGVFNMDCHYRPINKNTNAYIQDHTEDLFALAEWLFEDLLDRVFIQVEIIEQIRHEEAEAAKAAAEAAALAAAEEAAAERAAAAARARAAGLEVPVSVPMIGKSVTINEDFDVEEYELEAEGYAYSQVSAIKEPSLIVKPEKPYYIPLTDVPYPGEISSTYDLKKLLIGNYCHSCDLEHDIAKRKQLHDGAARLSIPENILSALFECYASNSDSEDDFTGLSLDSCEIEELEKYIDENMDKVSFAGHVIKRIANIPKKYDLFDDVKHETAWNSLLTDDELRIIRMAKSEYKAKREKKVSINAPSLKISRSKIIRRPTGYVRKEDFESFGIDSETLESLEEEDLERIKYKREVREREKNYADMANRETQSAPRRSVLTRLLEDVTVDSAGAGPTLKDFGPVAPLEKPFIVLTQSPMHFIDDEPEKVLYQLSSDSIDNALLLQHGPRIYRKLSSDYVRTIDHLEHKPAKSIRTLEYEKRRPSMSVSQYKMRNKKYQEMLQKLEVKKEENKAPAIGFKGLRLPGDSPIYSSTELGPK